MLLNNLWFIGEVTIEINNCLEINDKNSTYQYYSPAVPLEVYVDTLRYIHANKINAQE